MLRRFVLGFVVLTIIPFLDSGVSAAGHPAASSSAAGKALDLGSEEPPLDLPAVLDWKSIQSRTVSDDGRWFAYQLAPGEGDAELVLRSLDSELEHRFPIGDSPRRRFFGSGAPDDVVFSKDSRWLAFVVYPDHESTKAKKNGPDGDDKPSNELRLLDLENLAESPEPVEFDRVKGLAFSGDRATHLAVHREAPKAAAGPGKGGPGKGDKKQDRALGSDLLVRELSGGSTLTLGNVSELAFNDAGRFLALTVDVDERNGNGLQLFDLEAGTLRSLESGELRYHSLQWTEKGEAFALLEGTLDDDYENEPQRVIAYRDLESGAPTRVLVDPAELVEFPEAMTIADTRAPQWHDDLSAISFGIVELEKKDKDAADTDDESGDATEEEATEEEAAEEDAEEEEAEKGKKKPGEGDSEDDLDIAELVIWHWQDDRLQSQQQVQEKRDEGFSYLSLYRPDSSTFLRLADDQVRDIELDPSDRYATGIDRQPYELSGSLEGRRYADLYRVDLVSGDRQRVLEKVRWHYGTNPQGDRLLYYRDGHFHVRDLDDTGGERNLTAGLPTSFVDSEDDHNVVDPPIRPPGWTEDGTAVVLHDNWDLWMVRADGSGAQRITPAGKEEQVRYQRVYRLDEDDEGIDTTEPLYLEAYGEWTKQAGLARLDPGADQSELLFFDDAAYGDLMRAGDTSTFLFTRQTSGEFPDFRVAGADLGANHADARPVTEANPQQSEFAWSEGVRLVDYESEHGDRLQGALFLPAGYEEGRSYPTVVYIYERLSQGLNRYTQPVAYSFNKSYYTSNGYAVLMPDITYRVNDPGMSAVWSVLPALDAAVESGVVDPDHVAIHGHSWGGYQTSFLITQTDRFAAAVAGAPLTNMISMYSSIYWNTGSANQPIFESSQGRFEGSYLDNLEAYARNSPVYHAENVETPLLLLHNDKDGAVDWNQGIEYFNTLRRLEKPVVMLQYKGENHGLRDPANRRDYFVRMSEFLGHYLKGEPAPDWLAQGVDHLEHEEHLEERARDQERLLEERAGEAEESASGTAPSPH